MNGLFRYFEGRSACGENIDAAGQLGESVALGYAVAQHHTAGGVDIYGRLVGDALLLGGHILNPGQHVLLLEIYPGACRTGIFVEIGTVGGNGHCGVAVVETEQLRVVGLLEVVVAGSGRSTFDGTCQHAVGVIVEVLIVRGIACKLVNLGCGSFLVRCSHAAGSGCGVKLIYFFGLTLVRRLGGVGVVYKIWNVGLELSGGSPIVFNDVNIV